MKHSVGDAAGKVAGRLLRELALGMQGEAWSPREREDGKQPHAPSERLAWAIRRWDVDAAQAAWDEGSRIEASDHGPDSSEWGRHLALGARMWVGGWRPRDPERVDERRGAAMAAWLDAKGCLFAQRNKKAEAAALAAEPGSEQWRAARMESAALWPRVFERIEPGSPGIPAALAAVARGWVDGGWMSPEDGRILGSKIAAACWVPREGGAIPSKLGWIELGLCSRGLGGSLEDRLWLDLFSREADGGADRARAVLEDAAQGPSQEALSKIAALAAVRGDALLLAAAAEGTLCWDWMVDARAAAAASQAIQGPSLSGEAMSQRGGRMSALHAAAMGPARRAWANPGLVAMLSIPAAREAAARSPAPAALLRWNARELEWAARSAPELLAVDAKGRCLAHEWAREAGPWAVKRVASLARPGLGWMISQPDDKGRTPMGMLSGEDRAGRLAEVFARWERGEMEPSCLEPDCEEERGFSSPARTPRL